MLHIHWLVLLFVGVVGMVLVYFVARMFFLAGSRHLGLVTVIDESKGGPFRDKKKIDENRRISWLTLMYEAPHCYRSRALFIALFSVPVLLFSMVFGDYFSDNVVSSELCKSRPENRSVPPLELNQIIINRSIRVPLSPEQIDVLFDLYRITGNVPNHIRPIELSSWYILSPWSRDSINSSEVRYYRQERLQFFRSVIASRNNSADADLLAAYLTDIWDVDEVELMCVNDVSRIWLRVGVVIVLREIWPVDQAVIRQLVRISQSHTHLLEHIQCQEEMRRVLRLVAADTLRVWQEEHPEEFAALLEGSTPTTTERFDIGGFSVVSATSSYRSPSLTP